MEYELNPRARLENVQDESTKGEELADALHRLDGKARSLDLRELESVLKTHRSTPARARWRAQRDRQGWRCQAAVRCAESGLPAALTRLLECL